MWLGQLTDDVYINIHAAFCPSVKFFSTYVILAIMRIELNCVACLGDK
jgi:hypothetical protein